MKTMGQEKGYAMAALLVAMSVSAVLITVAMPTWKQMARREKEEELVFRGQQYVRAIRLYGQKYANANPPNLDVLVEQRFLRRKFKDPITNDDFQPILAGQAVPGSGGQQGRGAGAAPSPVERGPEAGPLTSGSQTAGRGGLGGGIGGGPAAGGPVGGVMGVMSKSKDTSIKIYNGRTHYNEWAFVYVPQVTAPGMGAPGVAAPGQRGGPQGQQPGVNPFGSGIGGQRGGRGRQGGNPPPLPPGGPGRGFGPPTSPFQPAPPTQPGRGRGGI
jgi:type II secretory pathway pseudopilin PulG